MSYPMEFALPVKDPEDYTIVTVKHDYTKIFPFCIEAGDEKRWFDRAQFLDAMEKMMAVIEHYDAYAKEKGWTTSST